MNLFDYENDGLYSKNCRLLQIIVEKEKYIFLNSIFKNGVYKHGKIWYYNLNR